MPGLSEHEKKDAWGILFGWGAAWFIGAHRLQAAGFAEGGPINVGGRSVHGEGNGKSDSLPAVIDGEHPAALSSGEFVMPVEAVRHFGLDRLNKMVAAARKGLDTGRESA